MFTFLRKKALLAILFLMSGIISSFAAPSGSGTEADPYLIGSAEDLVWFRALVNDANSSACAKLTEDIDLKDVCHPASDGVEEVSWVPIGNSSYNEYMGCFDGNNKTIRNLYFNNSDKADSYKVGGLFGYAYSCKIENLNLENANMTFADGDYGVVVGKLGNSNISNIKVASGTICKLGDSYRMSQSLGGIVGAIIECQITNVANCATIESSSHYIGGICGASTNCTFSNCANYGNIKGNSAVGGIIGTAYSTNNITNCANYGNIEATATASDMGTVGGFIGQCNDVTVNLKNILNIGNVISQHFGLSGLIIGASSSSSTITTNGIVAYSENCKQIFKNEENEHPLVPIGFGTINGVSTYSAETLKTGILTALLQQNVTDDAVWGQKLGTDAYPILWSTDRVYAIKDIHVNCLGTMLETDASFTNTPQETAGSITIKHCDSPNHYDAKAATCTEDGNVEYYECTICHRYFSDKDMTQGLASVVSTATGHNYVNGKCTKCDDELPTLSEGTTTIQIKAVNGYTFGGIAGYTGNLYKFTAPGDGTLTVYTTGDEDTYGTLWDSSLTKNLKDNDEDGEGSNFKFSYDVTKGTVYYIGVRQYHGNEISDYSITIEGTWPHEIEDLTITDKEPLNISKETSVTTLTYKRTFNNTNWQPLYVPFAMASADWKDKGLEVACINNFHEYNTSEGKKVVLEVNRVTAGVLHPNTPYLIRATEVGEKTITLNVVTLLTAENTYTCSSMTRNYNFKGIYSEKSSFDADNDYIVSSGSLMHISDDAVLSPQRWYVHVDNRYTMIDAEETAAQARSISIVVVGESSVTGIEEVGVKVADISSDAQGIYDLQGRRLGSAPKQGVFIMNGKKFVK